MNNTNTIRLSFLGDITCDRPMLKAAKRADGSYDFTESLVDLKKITSKADYTVGNLETIFAGKEKGYNPAPVTYNSPLDLLYEIKNIGIDMLSTANNHALDFGIEGLIKTAKEIEKIGIDYTGTHFPNQEKYKIVDIKGVKIGFIALTSVLNVQYNGIRHKKEVLDYLNFVGHYKDKDLKEKIKDSIKKIIRREKLRELKSKVFDLLNKPIIDVFVDNNPLTTNDIDAIRSLDPLFDEINSKSDYTIILLHSGGQFNNQVGLRTKQIVDMLLERADLIIGNHPHVIQKAEFIKGKPVAYSLGGVNMSMSGDYIQKDSYPDFSMVFNIDLEIIDSKVQLSKATAQFIKNRDLENNYTKLDLIEKDYQISADDKERFFDIAKIALGYEVSEIKDEYIIK